MQVAVQVCSCHVLPSCFPDYLVTVLIRLCCGSFPSSASLLEELGFSWRRKIVWKRQEVLLTVLQWLLKLIQFSHL